MAAVHAPPLARTLLVAALLAAAAVASAACGLDDALARVAFDPSAGDFPARHWPALELVGHRLAKSSVWIVWFVLLAASIASHGVDALAPHRRVLWATTAALALGPLTVAALKTVTGPRCPWDLIEFGGPWPHAHALFVRPHDAGRCFPAGHASGGYALVALHFAGTALGAPRLRRLGLWIGLLAGTAFGAVRLGQGAHFLSHTLWSAALAWTAAAGVFALACPRQPAARAATRSGAA